MQTKQDTLTEALKALGTLIIALLQLWNVWKTTQVSEKMNTLQDTTTNIQKEMD